jgi:holo-[acyl-carrier protein] synthase
MAIYGVGTDIIQVSRISAVLDRHGDRFAKRILGENEWVKYITRREKNAERGLRFLATRFAAKEAFSKAIGLGMRWPMSWRYVQTLNNTEGKPVLVYAGELSLWMEEKKLSAQVSITDEKEYAIAFVVVEK